MCINIHFTLYFGTMQHLQKWQSPPYSSPRFFNTVCLNKGNIMFIYVFNEYCTSFLLVPGYRYLEHNLVETSTSSSSNTKLKHKSRYSTDDKKLTCSRIVLSYTHYLENNREMMMRMMIIISLVPIHSELRTPAHSIPTACYKLSFKMIALQKLSSSCTLAND